MEERWVIINWNHNYEVSNLGRIRNSRTKRILKPLVNNSHKTPQVWLYHSPISPKYVGVSSIITWEKAQFSLVRIIYFTFHNAEDNHKRIFFHDGNPLNCSLDNIYQK